MLPEPPFGKKDTTLFNARVLLTPVPMEFPVQPSPGPKSSSNDDDPGELVESSPNLKVMESAESNSKDALPVVKLVLSPLFVAVTLD
jgi:hypothetical protein